MFPPSAHRVELEVIVMTTKEITLNRPSRHRLQRHLCFLSVKTLPRHLEVIH